MRTIGIEMRHACRSILQAPGDERHRRHHARPRAGRQRGDLLDDRRARAPAVHDARRRPDDDAVVTRPTDRQPARGRLSGRLSRFEKQADVVRAPRRVRMVDGEPRRQGRAGERPGILRLGRLLHDAGRATGIGPRFPRRTRRRPGGIGAWCSATGCGSAGSRPTRRSSAVRSTWMDEQYEVVGVAPPGFDFPMGAQIWAPLAFYAEAAANRRALYLTAIGRLAPGERSTTRKHRWRRMANGWRTSIPRPIATARCASTRSATA